ncbi:MAG: class I SAM-dependent methyltransferase [Roseiflexaceae bacterium]|nr:class I SAM-dependent methyltransferase [Roseiflexaceae bacterium]
MRAIDHQPYLRAEQYHTAANLDARISMHQRFSQNSYGVPRWLFDQVDARSTHMFEIGCGSGNIWQENAARMPDHWQLTLCDFSRGMVAQAQQNLAAAGVAARYLVADAQELPLQEATFDAAFAHFMLYHVPDRCRALGELRRVLKPGGRLYAATNGRQHLSELFDLAQQFDAQFNGWRNSASESFKIENGAAQLAAHFSKVTLLPYHDELLISDPEAVVSYIASFAPLSVAQQADFSAFVRDAFNLNGGVLRVTKASGLFIAEC